jgi:putative CRISPR-associated protein (TIGR02620 family)
MPTLVVTRHPALVDLLRERGLLPEGTQVLSHVETPDLIRGQDVIGVLPMSLAAVAASVTEIPLALTPELRGRELDLATLRQIAGEAVTYRVAVVPAVPETVGQMVARLRAGETVICRRGARCRLYGAARAAGLVVSGRALPGGAMEVRVNPDRNPCAGRGTGAQYGDWHDAAAGRRASM